MDCIATRLPYRQTNAFSKIALDYIDQAKDLHSFFAHAPSISGVQQAIADRVLYDESNGAEYRKTLVCVLQEQYQQLPVHARVQDNIQALLSPDTFTITTAHQNNLFTGPLYFIYKIIHAIKLADHLNGTIKGKRFVPVFYMGSEDADFEELNHIHLDGQKLTWDTKQTGAVGRMKIDKNVQGLINTMEGQIAVLPNGKEYIASIRRHYREGVTVQQATCGFVNELFAEYGLIVLIPDHADLKKQMISVFQADLFDHSPSSTVSKTAARLEAAGYKIQAQPRDVNLFFLDEGLRGRIDKTDDRYMVNQPESVTGPAISFSKDELDVKLREHPEVFSPNVILRGIYQEMILPNIVFIGGGGEIAYWLQYKDLFAHFNIPFPVLILRNSFLILEKKWQERISHLGFRMEDIFQKEEDLITRLVNRETEVETKLNGSLPALEKVYEALRKQAAAVDRTLEKHVDALKHRSVFKLQELEKKMWRAEKRKFADQQRQIHTLRDHLFPGDGLQERHDNLATYFAKWGPDFIRQLYDHSPALEQEFVVLSEK